ncbi:alkaline phosphatase family protein [Speluncibacter jeojiensis]|uniref:alkaline phosphatase family protein n=1 Tax=Speluncibacter jeojiensis TaxID=2710754 RepID=UPI002FC83F52
MPPGEHGVVGYLLAVPGQDRLMNPLAWRLHGPGPHVDLFKEVVPEQFQPRQTLFERAAADGVAVASLGPAPLERSGLTRASLRGGTFHATVSLGDLAASAAGALCAGRGEGGGESARTFVYAYHGELDYTGHVRGPDSEAWRLELAHVDRMARQIAERLPADGALVVTADHGMVRVGEAIDVDAEPELTEGVRLLGGEPRARHLYTEPGATERVRATWRRRLGEDFEVLDRADAIARGWFGPVVAPAVLPRIGDLLAVARSSAALIRRSIEPRQSSMLGHHGSLTPEEVEVPLLTFTHCS